MTLKVRGGDLALYHGRSMFRVFTPGEKVEMQEISPEDFVCGDVAVITYPGAKSVIHRVIRMGTDELQTMGDNNPQPDIPVKFNAEHRFYKVTGVWDLHGGYRKVLNGPAGMRLFRRNQRKMKCRRFCGRMLQHLDRFFFWRLPIMNLRQFGREKVYYHKNTPVVKLLPDGRGVYLKWYYRLLYKIAADVDGKKDQ